MQSRLVGRAAAMAALAMLCALAACGGGVNESAATMTYNARYVGTATPVGFAIPAGASTGAITATLSMSQLASTVTGTIVVVDPLAATQDTLLRAGVMGHTTSSGIDLAIVQPAGCALHLTGPLTLQGDGALDGTLVGSDCNATGASDLSLALHLTRQ